MDGEDRQPETINSAVPVPVEHRAADALAGQVVAASEEQPAATAAAEQHAGPVARPAAELEQTLAAAATATERAAQITAELKTAREQARAAAMLVLDLNSRLEAAQKREQKFQQTIGALQAELQVANQALDHDRAAIQALRTAQQVDEAVILRLTSQLVTARADIRWLSEQLPALSDNAAATRSESEQFAEQTRQLQAEQTTWRQQLSGLSAALQASRQERLETETRLEIKTQEIAELNRTLQQTQRQSLFAQGTLQTLRADQRVNSAEFERARQQYQMLEQNLAGQQRRWDVAQQAWAQEKAALQLALDTARRQLTEAENAVQAGEARLEISAGQNQALGQRLHDAQQALAASQSALENERAQLAEQSVIEEELAVSQTVQPARPVASHAEATDAGPVTDPCPCLGLVEDRDTRHGYASVANRCYALRSPLEVSFAQQAGFCLQNAHHQCPIFTKELRAPRVPIDTDAEAAQRAKRNGRGGWLTRR